MVKALAYHSRGSSREATMPSSHRRYSIKTGKILETLEILGNERHKGAAAFVGSTAHLYPAPPASNFLA